MVAHVQRQLGVSERRACRAMDQSRSSRRYRPLTDEEEKRLIAEMLAIVAEHPRYGYRMVWAMLRQSGWRVNRKRVYRLWVQEGLKVPRKQRKRRRLGHNENSCVRRKAEHKDHVWTWDFIHDRTTNGRPLKWLSIIDEHTRECLALEVDHGITAERAIDVLVELFRIRGVPQHIRSDNGPEFLAKAIRRWLTLAGVETLYVEPVRWPHLSRPRITIS
jgi:putative transposase